VEDEIIKSYPTAEVFIHADPEEIAEEEHS
jgi:divalent metal cation (Fe/Co/Zn/Cd) transporter